MSVRHEVEGPHVRLGIAWFAVVLLAALVAAAALGVVLAVAAALAAEQVVRVRAERAARRPGSGRLGPVQPTVADPAAGRLAALRGWAPGVLADPNRLVSVLLAGSLPLAAAAGPDTLAAAMAAGVMVVLAATTLSSSPPAGDRPGSRLAALASVIAPSLAFGGAAAAVVVVRAEGVAAAVIVVILVSAYEAGDHLVGTGSSTMWEGPAAGIAAVVVVALGASLVALVPLGRDGPLVLAGIVVVAAPAGPALASALIGDGRTSARYVRRLDAWLAVGPLAAWATAALAS